MGWDEGVKSLLTALCYLFVTFFPHPSVSWVLVEAKTVFKTFQILRQLWRCVNKRELFTVWCQDFGGVGIATLIERVEFPLTIPEALIVVANPCTVLLCRIGLGCLLLLPKDATGVIIFESLLSVQQYPRTEFESL